MDKSNKYLFTIRSLTGGGAERVVTILASRMVRDGYNVSILAYEKTDHDYEIDNNTKVYYMPPVQGGIKGKLCRLRDMDTLVAEIQPDVIVPFVGTVLYVSYAVAKKRKIPFIRTIRNSPWSEGGGALDFRIRNYLNHKAAAIMVQNEEQILYFPEKMRNKIFVVPNPISETFITSRKERYSQTIKRIISVGRLTSQKNQAFLIQCFDELHKKHNEITLEIYGTGTEEKRLRALIESKNLTDCCFLKGRNDYIVDVLKMADLFVLTSDFEGMPNALMEAMCLGVPCISSNCRTGPSSLIKHQVNGVLYNTGDKAGLISSLEWAYDNADKLEAMGLKARESIVSRYTYEKIYNDLLNLIKAI